MTEETRKRSSLTMEQIVAVGQWLQKNEEWLKSTQPAYPEAAEKASRELGLHVSGSSIKSIADAFKVTWETRRQTARAKSAKPVEELRDRMKEVEENNAVLKNRIVTLEADYQRLRIVCVALCDSLGFSPPAAAGFVPPSTRKITLNNTK